MGRKQDWAEEEVGLQSKKALLAPQGTWELGYPS